MIDALVVNTIDHFAAGVIFFSSDGQLDPRSIRKKHDPLRMQSTAALLATLHVWARTWRSRGEMVGVEMWSQLASYAAPDHCGHRLLAARIRWVARPRLITAARSVLLAAPPPCSMAVGDDRGLCCRRRRSGRRARSTDRVAGTGRRAPWLGGDLETEVERVASEIVLLDRLRCIATSTCQPARRCSSITRPMRRLPGSSLPPNCEPNSVATTRAYSRDCWSRPAPSRLNSFDAHARH